MDNLLKLGRMAAERLRARNETVAVADSSAGGMIAAALLAVPGASHYFLGAVNLYTPGARAGLLDLDPTIRSATVSYADLMARTVRVRLAASWGIGESGVAGPAPNRHGDPPGYTVIAIVGPRSHRLIVRTNSTNRLANMRGFAQAALKLLVELAESE